MEEIDMPQASDQLRSQMISRFGDIDSEGPASFLEAAGYRLNKDWTWTKPGINDLRDMSREEFDCLLFLVHEWDYGALTV